MRTSMPGRGRPTVWSTSSSGASNAVAVPRPPVSVDEYRTEYGAANRRRASRTRAAGDGPPPTKIDVTHEKSY